MRFFKRIARPTVTLRSEGWVSRVLCGEDVLTFCDTVLSVVARGIIFGLERTYRGVMVLMVLIVLALFAAPFWEIGSSGGWSWELGGVIGISSVAGIILGHILLVAWRIIRFAGRRLCPIRVRFVRT